MLGVITLGGIPWDIYILNVTSEAHPSLAIICYSTLCTQVDLIINYFVINNAGILTCTVSAPPTAIGYMLYTKSKLLVSQVD